jgi:hypothetical protein
MNENYIIKKNNWAYKLQNAVLSETPEKHCKTQCDFYRRTMLALLWAPFYIVFVVPFLLYEKVDTFLYHRKHSAKRPSEKQLIYYALYKKKEPYYFNNDLSLFTMLASQNFYSERNKLFATYRDTQRHAKWMQQNPDWHTAENLDYIVQNHASVWSITMCFFGILIPLVMVISISLIFAQGSYWGALCCIVATGMLLDSLAMSEKTFDSITSKRDKFMYSWINVWFYPYKIGFNLAKKLYTPIVKIGLFFYDKYMEIKQKHCKLIKWEEPEK